MSAFDSYHASGSLEQIPFHCGSRGLESLLSSGHLLSRNDWQKGFQILEIFLPNSNFTFPANITAFYKVHGIEDSPGFWCVLTFTISVGT